MRRSTAFQKDHGQWKQALTDIDENYINKGPEYVEAAIERHNQHQGTCSVAKDFVHRYWMYLQKQNTKQLTILCGSDRFMLEAQIRAGGTDVTINNISDD